MERKDVTYRNYSSVLETPSGEFRGVSPDSTGNAAAKTIPYHKNGARQAAMNSAEYMGLGNKIPAVRTKSVAYKKSMLMQPALATKVIAAKTKAY